MFCYTLMVHNGKNCIVVVTCYATYYEISGWPLNKVKILAKHKIKSKINKHT